MGFAVSFVGFLTAVFFAGVFGLSGFVFPAGGACSQAWGKHGVIISPDNKIRAPESCDLGIRRGGICFFSSSLFPVRGDMGCGGGAGSACEALRTNSPVPTPACHQHAGQVLFKSLCLAVLVCKMGVIRIQ